MCQKAQKLSKTDGGIPQDIGDNLKGPPLPKMGPVEFAFKMLKKKQSWGMNT